MPRNYPNKNVHSLCEVNWRRTEWYKKKVREKKRFTIIKILLHRRSIYINKLNDAPLGIPRLK